MFRWHKVGPAPSIPRDRRSETRWPASGCGKNRGGRKSGVAGNLIPLESSVRLKSGRTLTKPMNGSSASETCPRPASQHHLGDDQGHESQHQGCRCERQRLSSRQSPFVLVRILRGGVIELRPRPPGSQPPGASQDVTTCASDIRNKYRNLSEMGNLHMNSTEYARIGIGIVTVSDRASRGEYEDRGGPAIRQYLQEVLASPWEGREEIVPDELPGARGTGGLADQQRLLPDHHHRRHGPGAARRDTGSHRGGVPEDDAGLWRTACGRSRCRKYRPPSSRGKPPVFAGSA